MDVIYIEQQNLSSDYSVSLCEQMEQGNILVLKQTPYLPAPDDAEFLRELRQTDSNTHKNIAYKPHIQRTTGTSSLDSAEAERLKIILATFSAGAIQTMERLFAPYARTWRVDYASFRPVEEQGRKLSLSHRNDLMHLDAFPTRPTHGGRILRAFTNLHPERDRVWATSEPFEKIAAQYAEEAGLSRTLGPFATLKRQAAQLAKSAGLKKIVARSPYDQFMIQFHHYLKASAEFQKAGRVQETAFGPGATWICFTDQIAHAVTTGQYALEQTCIVPYAAMLKPQLAPVSVLERLAGRPLIAQPHRHTNVDQPERQGVGSRI